MLAVHSNAPAQDLVRGIVRLAGQNFQRAVGAAFVTRGGQSRRILSRVREQLQLRLRRPVVPPAVRRASRSRHVVPGWKPGEAILAWN